MTAKRIPQLDAITGANTASGDQLVIFDTDANVTKRIVRSQLATGLVGDLPYTPAGFISATTVPTAIAEIASDLAASGGAALIGNSPSGIISSVTVQGAINEIVSDLAAASGAALIGNDPAGNILATTVQDAINELDTEKQAANSALTDISGLSKTDGNIIVGDGTNWVAESGATARTSLGLGTGDSPRFTAIELGAATDTTITRASAGVIAVEGSNVLLASNIGTSVQGYDADTAKIDTAQTFTAQQTLSSGLVLQTVAAADIAAIANAINTTNKVLGKVIYDTTNKRLMIADGSAAVDPWYVADGSAFVTPS